MTSLPHSAVAWFAVCDCVISWSYSSADLESFARGDPTLSMFYLFLLMREERIQIQLKEGHQQPGQLWPNIKCWLGSFVNFQGVWTSIAKKPKTDLSGGGSLPPSGSVHDTH